MPELTDQERRQALRPGAPTELRKRLILSNPPYSCYYLCQLSDLTEEEQLLILEHGSEQSCSQMLVNSQFIPPRVREKVISERTGGNDWFDNSLNMLTARCVHELTFEDIKRLIGDEPETAGQAFRAKTIVTASADLSEEILEFIIENTRDRAYFGTVHHEAHYRKELPEKIREKLLRDRHHHLWRAALLNPRTNLDASYTPATLTQGLNALSLEIDGTHLVQARKLNVLIHSIRTHVGSDLWDLFSPSWESSTVDFVEAMESLKKHPSFDMIMTLAQDGWTGSLDELLTSVQALDS